MNNAFGMVPMIEKPSDITLEKIDFIIQGLENGLFKDLSKKIDFHQKLKGEDPKKFIQSLIDVIEAQATGLSLARQDYLDLEERIRQNETRIIELENKVQNYNNDMRGVANALIKISSPDPLGQGNNYVDDAAIASFISMYKSKY